MSAKRIRGMTEKSGSRFIRESLKFAHEKNFYFFFSNRCIFFLKTRKNACILFSRRGQSCAWMDTISHLFSSRFLPANTHSGEKKKKGPC